MRFPPQNQLEALEGEAPEEVDAALADALVRGFSGVVMSDADPEYSSDVWGGV